MIGYKKEEKEKNILYANNNMKADYYKKSKANGEIKISLLINLILSLKFLLYIY
jgi:hypothetical protein